MLAGGRQTWQSADAAGKELGANLDPPFVSDELFASPLGIAVQRDHEEAVRALYEMGANTLCADEGGGSAFYQVS